MRTTGFFEVLHWSWIALAACSAALTDDAARPQSAAHLGPAATAVSSDGHRLCVCLSDGA